MQQLLPLPSVTLPTVIIAQNQQELIQIENRAHMVTIAPNLHTWNTSVRLDTTLTRLGLQHLLTGLRVPYAKLDLIVLQMNQKTLRLTTQVQQLTVELPQRLNALNCISAKKVQDSHKLVLKDIQQI